MIDCLKTLLETLGEERARRMLDGVGTPQAIRAFNRFAAETRGQRWLAEGMTLNDVVHRMGVRAGVRAETAYRWLRELKKD